MNRFEYAESVFLHEDGALRATREDIVARGMPAIFVSPYVGAILNWLVHVKGARRVLEIGALGGYSGIWLARGLGEDGTLTSLEINPEYARVARSNLERAGLGERVEYRIGPALDSLKRLGEEGARFDFVFIDADKENYPAYLEETIRLALTGAIIAADNTLQGDRVTDPAHREPSTEAIRRFNDRAATDPRLRSLLIPLGDGLTVAEVLGSAAER